MNLPGLFDNAQWEALLMGRAAELGDDPAGCEQLVYRLLGQYLPALLSARNQEGRDRVWRSLWQYMTMPATRAKPFSLSHSSADGLLDAIQEELARLGIGRQG